MPSKKSYQVMSNSYHIGLCNRFTNLTRAMDLNFAFISLI